VEMRAAILIVLCSALFINAYFLPVPMTYCTSTNCDTLNTAIVLDNYAANSAADFTRKGLTANGNLFTIHSSIRGYLVNASSTGYQPFYLLDKEFSFDVVTNNITCGGNGALYLSSMHLNGTDFQRGGGYCDANNERAFCDEFDLWEANTYATAMTAHPCVGGACDRGGCQVNPYRTVQKDFYGPGKSVDTKSKFTVVTQFFTTGGILSQVKRFYIQDGKKSASYSIGTVSGSTVSCSNESNGGFRQMSTALDKGMVLIFSLWSSNGGMTWLDSGENGPCTTENYVSGSVTFGNFKVAPIGSTFGATPN